ncbi:MAG: MBL fold metallo-hydrolase [Oscillospiraceae bacterium]|nr:MBL fold metallo-hydrolase [Oscillospiraceae bacterium]
MAKKKTNINDSKKSKRSLLYTIVVTILFAIACLNGRLMPQDEKMEQGDFALSDAEFQVHMINVGQADSILVIADGEAMLIDAAESGNAQTILDYLAAQNIKELKYAAATHMHADHIGGYGKVFAGIKVKTVLEPVYADSLVPTTKTYERYLDGIDVTGAKLRAAKAGSTYQLGSATITVLGPVSKNADDLNNTSLVLRVDYEDVSCLFTGDMEEPEEEEILASSADLDVDYLKVGHHGASTSSSEAFLAAVTPQYAAISCGEGNDYGHPTPEALERLGVHTDNILITKDVGDVVFCYDKDTGTCSFTGTDTKE